MVDLFFMHNDASTEILCLTKQTVVKDTQDDQMLEAVLQRGERGRVQ